ncbi:methyltransferase domain-containing protein [Aeromonas salmonicida]|uniref:methyltransferase domain-containing protein n=1 Tax=Aeromonas salmonicida TaxID=645 RepID=UPI00240D61C8|nr:methyltransferase domain-containing protein [Aeromonas salmonicida]WFC14009.1 methyltransferase domain-containing protein [Aeromonas salmonicida]
MLEISEKGIRLYAGDIPGNGRYTGLIGLSLNQENDTHIPCDLTTPPYPFDDNTVDFFQSEDVFEHIPYTALPAVFDEIFRILRPGALFRLSLPDYYCDVLYKRSVYDFNGNIVFDPLGGGTFEEPGHVWFPTFESVSKLISSSRFEKYGHVHYLHYYVDREQFVVKPIDYSMGYIQRTPDNDPRVSSPYRPMSLVVDLYKGMA